MLSGTFLPLHYTDTVLRDHNTLEEGAEGGGGGGGVGGGGGRKERKKEKKERKNSKVHGLSTRV